MKKPTLIYHQNLMKTKLIILAALFITTILAQPTTVSAAIATPTMTFHESHVSINWLQDTEYPEAPSEYVMYVTCIETCGSNTPEPPSYHPGDPFQSYYVSRPSDEKSLIVTIEALDASRGTLYSYPILAFDNPAYTPPPPPPPTPGAPSLSASGAKISASWGAYPGISFYTVEACGNVDCTPYTGDSPIAYTNSITLEPFFSEHKNATVKVFAHDASYTIIYAYPHATIANPNYTPTPDPTPTPLPQVTTITQATTTSDPNPEPEVLGVEDETEDDISQEVAEEIEETTEGQEPDQQASQTSDSKDTSNSPIVDFIAEYWYLLAGGLVLALGGILGAYWRIKIR